MSKESMPIRTPEQKIRECGSCQVSDTFCFKEGHDSDCRQTKLMWEWHEDKTKETHNG